MAATIIIAGATKTLELDIGVLGVQINTRLGWRPRRKRNPRKKITQNYTLTKIYSIHMRNILHICKGVRIPQ